LAAKDAELVTPSDVQAMRFQVRSGAKSEFSLVQELLQLLQRHQVPVGRYLQAFDGTPPPFVDPLVASVDALRFIPAGPLEPGDGRTGLSLRPGPHPYASATNLSPRFYGRGARHAGLAAVRKQASPFAAPPEEPSGAASACLGGGARSSDGGGGVGGQVCGGALPRGGGAAAARAAAGGVGLEWPALLEDGGGHDDGAHSAAQEEEEEERGGSFVTDQSCNGGSVASWADPVPADVLVDARTDQERALAAAEEAMAQLEAEMRADQGRALAALGGRHGGSSSSSSSGGGGRPSSREKNAVTGACDPRQQHGCDLRAH
jgi:hypothetical protein